MPEKSNSKRNLLIALAVIILIGVAGYFYATRTRVPDDTLLSSTPVGDTAAVDSDLLSALRELRKLKLDASVFSTPAWSTLHDFGQTLSPLPAGRPNPFAPFEGTSTPAR